MLKKIRSNYILRIVFIFLDEKQKLKIIKYNKSLQKDLLNELDYFKKISGRYIIQDTTYNCGKEFTIDKNTLVYIGGYKNGKRNGKGVEYDENGIYKFEGEFLNGRRNGQGKEYRKSENYNKLIELSFEGIYKNGKRNGKGVEYNENGKYKFEGEFLKDLKEGFGKEYYKNGNIKFEGEYKKDKIWNGKGYDINGNIDYIISEGNGNIKLYEYDTSHINFEGEYKNGEKNGKGKEYNYYGKLKFEGEFLNGKRDGEGKEYFEENNKILFEGEYKEGKKWKGKGYDNQGNIIYELNNGQGYVKLYNDEYCYFEGEYKNGEANGYGKSFWRRRFFHVKKIFEGIYKNGEKFEGKKYDYNWNEGNEEIIYEGTFKNNKYFNGKKISNLYSDDKYEGEYLNGEKWKGIEKIYGRFNKITELEYIEGKIKKVKGYNPENGEIDYIINNGNGTLKYYKYYINIKNIRYKEIGKLYLNFEMQLINGEIKGIGKEYNENGKLMFEGEFYNGAKNGKGKIYNEKGKLIFEGEIYNDLKNGYGKEYFSNGKLKFEGIYINNEKFKGINYDNKGEIKYEIKNGDAN